jgi:hypothetical protein
VQDFLNSRASEAPGPDMLRDAASAEVWAAHVVRAWSVQRTMYCQPPALTDHDTSSENCGAHARRSGKSPLGAKKVPRHSAAHTGGAAEFSYVPKGQGWQWFCGAILGILLSRNVVAAGSD